MNLLTHFIWVPVICIMIFLISCAPVESENKDSMDEHSNEKIEIEGYYVSESYFRKAQGYDWVGVIIKKDGESQIRISIRSRADKKDPTCTYDGALFNAGNYTFTNTIDGSEITYKFSSDSLTITANDRDGSDAIMYYCSGGGSFEGTYTKIDGPLDPNQVDQTIYQDFLTLQDVGYIVKSLPDGDNQKLEIVVIGVPGISQVYNETTENKIKATEIEDLDSDGSPELIIFFDEYNINQNKLPFIFSIRNGSSLEKIEFPDPRDYPENEEGHIGGDNFAVVETSVVRRFQVYKIQGADTIRTGTTRQIIYKLGENGNFTVADIQEY